MDTHSIDLPLPEAEATRRALDQVARGGDAVLLAPDGADGMLGALAESLAVLPTRVLRVTASGPGGLSLSGLMAQVTGHLDLEAHDDGVVERGFQALTSGDAAGGAVALLVDHAGCLQRTALRYIQFACRSGPALRLVLVDRDGAPGLLQDAALLGDELSYLRTRLAAHPVIRLAGTVPSSAMPASIMPASIMPDAAPSGPGPALAAPASTYVGADPVPLPPSQPLVVARAAPPALAGALLPGAMPADILRSVLMPERPASARPAPTHPVSAYPVPAGGPRPDAPARDRSPLVAAAGRRRRPALWAVVGFGMAASAAAGVVIDQQGWVTHPPPAAEAVAPAPGRAAPSTTVSAPPAPPPGQQLPRQQAPASPAPGPQAATPGQDSPRGPSPSVPAGVLPIPDPVADGSVAAEATTNPMAATQPTAPVAPDIAQPPQPAPAEPVQAEGAPPRARAGRVRQVEVRGRDQPPPRRHAARVPDHSASTNGRFRPLSPEADGSWQPGPAAPWEPAGHGIVGTYATDPNGVRVFRSIE